ncbi:hypothetical protein [Butyrivibrio sp. MC2021]|nr:hypothetical protein [Butyrivibrio sp. MC2021]
MPYIHGKTLAVKWIGPLIGFPILAAILAYISGKLDEYAAETNTMDSTAK